ncbi:hypothetical protein [Dyella sp. 2HG41-7]|uniref:hypothetical protein n=1 Tax=Dyella sp. 2HG41-7 TaxID=2883239 RepID=UPI001F29B096|nr:hypothetical protein [Dyella sp. 2HG41-7]
MNTYFSKAPTVLLAVVFAVVIPGVKAQNMKSQPVASQPVSIATPMPPSQLSMPLVGLDEGQRFQASRAVLPSSVPVRRNVPSVGSAEAQPSLSGVNGEVLANPLERPTLGHALPTTTTTPLGFPRADFAIDRGKAAIKTSSASQSSGSAVSNAVIQ